MADQIKRETGRFRSGPSKEGRPRKRFGRYEVERLVGDGGTGWVYRAFDPMARRVVAIKTPKIESLTEAESEWFLRRFQQEAQAAGSLSHPNIVTIFDVADDYFVMEFLEGLTLDARLEGVGRLEIPEALRILDPVADAIDYAHRKGTVHRDLKPSNIMILSDGRPKIMDFGIAHCDSATTTAKAELLGSPSYMAPEQITSSEVSAKGDLFSLATLAYEMIGGQKPFEGESVGEILYNISNVEAPALSARNPEVPRHFNEVFRRALSKDPSLRYPTASSFVDALRSRSGRPEATPLQPSSREPMELEPLPDRRTSERRAAPPKTPGFLQLSSILAAVALLVALGDLALWYSTISRGRGRDEVAAVSRGGMAIVTEPQRAEVLVDGVEAGRSPLTFFTQPGRHGLWVVLEGFSPAHLTLDLPPGEKALPIRFVLRPAAQDPPQGLAQDGDGVVAARRVSGAQAPYPEAARPLRLEGTVAVELTVTEEGLPTDLQIVESAGETLDEAFLASVRGWRYVPAQKGRAPVRTRIRVKQSFSIG